MIEISNKKDCCGCTACVAICPKDAIVMKEDNEGFLYPVIEKDTCINCGACERVCPIIHTAKEETFEQAAYVVQNKDQKVLRESTAGGAFTGIAKYVLHNNGVVVGVELGDDLTARHIVVKVEDDLYRFRNSKYVQSSVGNTYREAKAFLEQGKLVCFSGTPCQIEGLKNFLKKEYDNLITVDVVCRAVPSPLIFRKYIEYQKKTLEDSIKTVRFRDKHYGYKYSTMNIITDKNHGNYHQGVESDPWLRAFFSNICDRPSCHECHFRKQYRVSDFTIWDCFNVGRFSKKLDNDKGATRVLIHTEKGRKIFDIVKDDFSYVQVSTEDAVAGVKEMRESVEPNDKRESFFKDANRMNGEELFNKYFANSIKVSVEHCVRLICYKLGIYSVVKKLYVRVTHKY